ncbi:MAG: hypothetical protein MJZ15_06445 [Bacteroidales bacterium]|nr:hypothetical protein [Bacteroidales bacterium]
MKALYKYMFGSLAVSCLVACQPEEFDGANPNMMPTVGNNQINVTVDQETNTMTASTEELANQYIIWFLDGKMYSNLPTINYSTLEAGTHSLELKVGNRNGISLASKTAEFTFNETKIDYSIYFKKLCNVEWRIDYATKSHMGCGESGTDGSGWWSAAVNDKADWGVYDDRIVFTHDDNDPAAGGKYSYNPGEGGTVYVNTGCSVFADQNTNDGADFMANVEKQNSTFTLLPGQYNDEDCLFIQFPAETLLPYIPNDDAYSNPYFRIESLSSSTLSLINDNGSIAWRLVFTSKPDTGLPDEPEAPEAVMDWDVASASNLWTVKSEDDLTKAVEFWWADENWGQVGDPTYEYKDGVLSLTSVACGSQKWQGQVKIHTSIPAVLSKKYDFYCVVESSNALPGMTFKLTEDGNDGNNFMEDTYPVADGKKYIYKIENVQLPKADAPTLMLVFDFGGTPEGTLIKVHDIYFAEHLSMEPGDEDNIWKVQSEDDLADKVEFWWADENWGQVGNPSYEYKDGVLSLTSVACGSQTWQGQVKIHTNIPASMADAYNFKMIIEGDNDMPNVTVKLTEDGNDGNFYMEDHIQVADGKPYTYLLKGANLPKADAAKLMLVLDFGGTPEGTNIKIHDIVFKKAN